MHPSSTNKNELFRFPSSQLCKRENILLKFMRMPKSILATATEARLSTTFDSKKPTFIHWKYA